MRINNNLMAMNTHRQLGVATNSGAKATEKLSSGFRINRAGDDAAGLAISEKMRGQIRGLTQASRNAQDGISLIQTAEGALNETHAILQRMRELAVQSATDTNTDADRAEIQKEIDQLATEITRIAETTQFNTMELLDGKFEGVFHIGANEKQNITLAINNMDADALKVGSLPGASFTINATKAESVTEANISKYVGAGTYDAVKLDKAVVIDTTEYEYALINEDGKVAALSEDGKGYSALEEPKALDKMDTAALVDEAVKLEFVDPVISGEVVVVHEEDSGSYNVTATATATVNDDDMKLANGIYTVTGDVDDQKLLDSEGKVVATSTDGKKWLDISSTDPDAVVLNLETALGDEAEVTVGSEGGLNVSSQKSADKAITTINDALETVSAERSKLGALQNRLEHTIKNLDTSAENLQASESRIRDIDMAQEMMEFTKQNILQQASTAMLAQANMAPQSVLQLLR